jgi:hypothetical protein
MRKFTVLHLNRNEGIKIEGKKLMGSLSTENVIVDNNDKSLCESSVRS